MYFKPVSLLVCLLYFSIRLAQAYKGEEDIQYGIRLSENLKNTRDGVTALKRVVTDIDQDLQRHQRSWELPCHFGGGNPGYPCHMEGITRNGMARSWVADNPLSPGKRSSTSSDSADRGSSTEHIKRTLSDLTHKRRGLEILRRILDEMEADLVVEQKRTCKLNLGGHCATESAAAVADQWHYLNSPMSPGRKRRDTGLYKKLISGKILQ